MLSTFLVQLFVAVVIAIAAVLAIKLAFAIIGFVINRAADALFNLTLR